MLVIWPNGDIEDPSAILGMRTNKNYDAYNAKTRFPKVRQIVRDVAHPIRMIQRLRRAA
jgi:hypothetical protein